MAKQQKGGFSISKAKGILWIWRHFSIEIEIGVHFRYTLQVLVSQSRSSPQV